MIIPVCCMTCGRIIGHLWELYVEKTKHYNAILNKSKKGQKILLDPEHADKMARGKALDDLGLKKDCCRVSMLCHVNLTSRLRNRYQD